MKITVIIRDGVVENVLGDSNAADATPDIEIINQDKDYEDTEKIENHITEIYGNKDMEEISYHTFGGEEDCEMDTGNIDEMLEKQKEEKKMFNKIA